MQLKNKTAVIFGGSGAIGSAAYALAREGAHVWLAARTQTRLDRVADRIRAAGGSASTLIFNALDESSPLPDLAHIDIAVNATGFMHDQGNASKR
jgi:short-subunit dehydrogenase